MLFAHHIPRVTLITYPHETLQDKAETDDGDQVTEVSDSAV